MEPGEGPLKRPVVCKGPLVRFHVGLAERIVLHSAGPMLRLCGVPSLTLPQAEMSAGAKALEFRGSEGDAW